MQENIADRIGLLYVCKCIGDFCYKNTFKKGITSGQELMQPLLLNKIIIVFYIVFECYLSRYFLIHMK